MVAVWLQPTEGMAGEALRRVSDAREPRDVQASDLVPVVLSSLRDASTFRRPPRRLKPPGYHRGLARGGGPIGHKRILSCAQSSRLSILMLAVATATGVAARALAVDAAAYCNSVQNKVGFIRFPLGTVGVWSTGSGEMADVMTRVPRVYPCVDSVVMKVPKEDWRASVSGDPSTLFIRYQTNKPSGASTMAITVSPHVSVFKVTFPSAAQRHYLVLDFTKGDVDSWARLNKWTERTVTRLDNRIFQATIGEPGKPSAWYQLRLNEPCIASGTFDATGAMAEGSTNVTGLKAAMYAQFERPTVTVTVAISFSGPQKAGQFLDSASTDFEAAQRQCHSAWERVLDRVELDGPENAKRMSYTALYTLYANLIDGTDGSCYSRYYPHPLSLASSAYWQFIGGYQSCCWDNIRASYPFLTLAYPEVVTDLLGTYLARYQRDGCLDGDICLFSGPSGHNNIRFVPVLAAQARTAGVRADYAKLYAALKDNFENDAFTPPTLRTLGYMTQPTNGGFACSRTLEFTTGFHSLAILSEAEGDSRRALDYWRLSKAYTNLWDPENRVFRVKNPDGTWGPSENQKMTWNPNPQGLFEGTSKDWMFGVPHDPYGLLNLPAQEDFADRLIEYCTNECWFNDYQTCYPYLLYYWGSPNAAQNLIRTSWVPMFEQGIMYEGVRPRLPHNGWQAHYTGNSGWLLCAMLGLYPVPAPPGQFIISSPSVSKALIHRGTKDISLEASNNTGSNIFIYAIKVDGKPYPAYMIPAKRLVGGTRIELTMGSDPNRRLGDLYIGSSDGFILNAELLSAAHLRCTIESPAPESTTKLYSRTRPAQVLIDGRETNRGDYSEASSTLTLRTTGTAVIEIRSL